MRLVFVRRASFEVFVDVGRCQSETVRSGFPEKRSDGH